MKASDVECFSVFSVRYTGSRPPSKGGSRVEVHKSVRKWYSRDSALPSRFKNEYVSWCDYGVLYAVAFRSRVCSLGLGDLAVKCKRQNRIVGMK
jgi:hypothetical protein